MAPRSHHPRPDDDAAAASADAGVAAAGADASLKDISRYGRRAEVVTVDRLTTTGTVRIALQVIDRGSFTFAPGHFVAVRQDVPGYGPARSPYCIFSPPGPERSFDLLLRVFPEGPLPQHLASLNRGDLIHFRGPSGRSMIPGNEDTELILLATGVGVSPFNSLCRALLAGGHRGRIRLYWGLRLADDICLTEDLDELASRHRNFTYQISLSPPSWPGLRGRVTESVPPLLDALNQKRFYLSGNGAMVEEMEVALTSLGVDRASIHEERFFNLRHRPKPDVIDAIVSRFADHDPFSLRADLLAHGQLFHLDRDVKGRLGHPPR